jgi:ATP-dependent Lhr-like helicase
MALAARFLRASASEAVELIETTGDGKEILIQVRGYRERTPSGKSSKAQEGVLQSEEDSEEWHVQAIAQHLYDQLRGGHHLAFANSRNLVEGYADRLRQMCERNRVPNEFLPHHGSLAKELREDGEARLKDRSLPAMAICTSTLELGIDIGDVESVAQIGTPFSVSSLRQRLGRSGRRDKPATLRMYVSEPEITPASPVLDTLHTDLVQAVAMIELLIDRWCEPPELGALHLSTLVQQVMSMTAQYGGIRAQEAWVALCQSGPFANIDQSRLASLLRCMGREGLLQQSEDGILVLGEKGERIVEHFSFYAVFSTPEEFRVEHAGHALGAMAFDLSLTVGLHIIFAGRRWKVIAVDTEAKVVAVEPAPGGRVPRFAGSRGGLVHDRIRLKMREVYESAGFGAYLNAEARVMLTEARTAYARFGLATSRCVRDGSDTVIFLCRGDRIMNTIAVMLLARGSEVEVAGPALTVQRQLPDAVDSQLKAIARGPVAAAEELAASVQNKGSEKYDWVLDEPLLCIDYAARSLDVTGSIEAVRFLDPEGCSQ